MIAALIAIQCVECPSRVAMPLGSLPDLIREAPAQQILIAIRKLDNQHSFVALYGDRHLVGDSGQRKVKFEVLARRKLKRMIGVDERAGERPAVWVVHHGPVRLDPQSNGWGSTKIVKMDEHHSILNSRFFDVNIGSKLGELGLSGDLIGFSGNLRHFSGSVGVPRRDGECGVRVFGCAFRSKNRLSSVIEGPEKTDRADNPQQDAPIGPIGSVARRIGGLPLGAKIGGTLVVAGGAWLVIIVGFGWLLKGRRYIVKGGCYLLVGAIGWCASSLFWLGGA